MENILAKYAQVKCPNVFVIIVCVRPAVWLHMLRVAQRTTLWSWLSSYAGGIKPGSSGLRGKCL